MIVHFGETLPEQITPEHIISTGLLFVWALCIFCGMLFCFGIGAATGPPTSLLYSMLKSLLTLLVVTQISFVRSANTVHKCSMDTFIVIRHSCITSKFMV